MLAAVEEYVDTCQGNQGCDRVEVWVTVASVIQASLPWSTATWLSPPTINSQQSWCVSGSGDWAVSRSPGSLKHVKVDWWKLVKASANNSV